MTIILFLLVIAVVLTAAELFVPGGVLGLAATGAYVAAIALTYARYGSGAGNVAVLVFIVLALIGVPLWLRWLPRSRWARGITLRAADDARTAPTGTMPGVAGLAPGDVGVALTDLRPAGAASFVGRRVDVVAEGALIPREARVRVLQVEGLRIVVRREETEHAPASLTAEVANRPPNAL